MGAPDPSAAPVLALIVAMAAERRALERALGPCRRERKGGRLLLRGRLAGQEVLLLQAGIGIDRARRAVAAAAGAAPLAGAWSLGFAGGLHPDLPVGDLVCPARVLHDAGPAREAPPAQERVLRELAAAGCGVHGGSLLTVDAPLRTPEAKRAAAGRTGAVAVDMEAAGVASAAAALGLPWLALKAVLDPADAPLPARLARCTTAQGNPRWRGILAALVAGPEGRRTLWAARAAAGRAAAGLERGLGPALRAWARLDATRALQ
jgi:adenosylhomocysteine nucleosidase